MKKYFLLLFGEKRPGCLSFSIFEIDNFVDVTIKKINKKIKDDGLKPLFAASSTSDSNGICNLIAKFKKECPEIDPSKHFIGCFKDYRYSTANNHVEKSFDPGVEKRELVEKLLKIQGITKFASPIFKTQKIEIPQIAN